MSEKKASEMEFPEDVAKIPCGRFDIDGKVTYADGNGNKFTPEQYKQVHGVDPEPLWQKVKEYTGNKPPIKLGGEHKPPFRVGKE